MRDRPSDDVPRASGDPQGSRLGRRRVLRLGAGAVLALGGVALGALRARGYALAPDRRLLVLSASQFVALQHAARRIAAPDRDDPSIPGADALDVAGFVDAWLVHMPQPMRRDLGRFLAYVEHLAPLAVGYTARFSRLPPADQDRVLASTEASSIDLLRAGFDGLKALVFIGYYRDPSTWPILGYDGPLVARPVGGWSGPR